MIRTTVLIILFLLTLISCRKDNDCILGNGISSTQELREYGFDDVSVSGDYFQVFVHIGEPNKNIIFEGESNILPIMYLDIGLNRLEIQTLEDVCIQPTIPIKLDISNPQLTSIGLYGDSFITTDSIFTEHFRIFLLGSGLISANITTDSLTIDTYHSAHIEVKGRAVKGYLNNRDNAQIKSYPLKQDSCYVTVTGSGLVYVNVERYLNIKIDGDGTVYYIGDPTVIADINGSGTVVHE